MMSSGELDHDSQQNYEEILSNVVVSTVPADGLAPSATLCQLMA